MASISSTNAGRTPEYPCPSEAIFKAMTRRVSDGDKGGPEPTVWDSTRLVCRGRQGVVRDRGVGHRAEAPY